MVARAVVGVPTLLCLWISEIIASLPGRCAVTFADLSFADLVIPIAAVLEHARRAVEQRLLPGMDLARVDTELAGQFANRAIAFDRRQGHLRLMPVRRAGRCSTILWRSPL